MKVTELISATVFILCVEGFFGGLFLIFGCNLPIKYSNGACIYSPLTATQALYGGIAVTVISIIVGIFAFLYAISE